MHLKHTFFLFGLLVSSANIYALNLDDAIQAALQNEQGLKQQVLAVEKSQAILSQAKTTYGLDVNLVGQFGRERVNTFDNTLFPAAGERTMRSLELQFDYPVYTWGRQQLGVQAAQLQKNARIQALSGQRSTTILQTVQVYTDVLKQIAMLNLQKKSNQNLQRAVYEAEKKFAAGIITRADFAQARSQYAQGQADLVTAQSNLDISHENFKYITGLEPTQLVEVNHIPMITESIYHDLARLEDHSAIRQAKLELSAAQKQLQLTKKELKPLVNLTSRIGMQHDATTINSRSDNYMVGVQVKVPLYDHGENKANIEKANIEQKIAQQQLDDLRLNMNRYVRQSYAQIQAIRQNKTALKDAIQSAEIAYTYIQKELEVGSKTTFDLLNAEQKLLELETQQAINQQDEVFLLYKLYDQTGRLESFYIQKNHVNMMSPIIENIDN